MPESMVEDITHRVVARYRETGSLTVLGLCGAQGSGKSTLAMALKSVLVEQGVTTVILSLDDLYLRRSEREALARDVHPLLATRGVPGTHDVALGLATLDSLTRGGLTRVPRFDKAADDRQPTCRWDIVEGPTAVVIFEGWCVGARPQADAELVAPINRLEMERDSDGRWRRGVNAQLSGSYQALFDRIDVLVLLQAPDFDVVHEWRAEQEAALRSGAASMASPGVMSDDALRTFIAHYERLTRHILCEMPARADLVVSLDAQRKPQSLRSNTNLNRAC